jgi:hypothetical protein
MAKRHHQLPPRWLREGKPPPYPDAFKDVVESIPLTTCCSVHRERHIRLLAAVRTPAGVCLVCGGLGTMRTRWTPSGAPLLLNTPCTDTATEVELGLYYDTCDTCRVLPSTPVQVDILMRQRYRAPCN